MHPALLLREAIRQLALCVPFFDPVNKTDQYRGSHQPLIFLGRRLTCISHLSIGIVFIHDVFVIYKMLRPSVSMAVCRAAFEPSQKASDRLK